MVASLKATVPGDDGFGTSKSQVVEIEPKNQPGSSRVQEEDHGDTHDESDVELEHETVHQENVQTLQQRQLEDSLASTRPRQAYKQIQKLGLDQPLGTMGR
ncbi:Uncharacterized protein Adt_10156 [Abeliophyllum distichum]|uniref:Uncharacterized protein n=1 Tax=Abeliophyllum distichum TaxID=126358 RepID=A0ABD1UJ72_9LAMI